MIHYDLDFAAYKALPGWNWSLINQLNEGSPRHVQHARHAVDNDTAARAKLRAIHTMVLEGNRFRDQFATYDGRRAGKDFDAFKAEHPGKSILNPTEADAIWKTATAILDYPPARELLRFGRGEVSLTWDDPETGLPCKGRIDWLAGDSDCKPRALVDLKTLGTTNERQVSRMVAAQGIHGQLAHYAAGLQAHGIDVPAYIVVAEGKGAQDVAVFEIDAGIPDGALYVGSQLRMRLLRKLKESVDADYWPGRFSEAQPLCLPPYALIDAANEFEWSEEATEVSEEVF